MTRGIVRARCMAFISIDTNFQSRSRVAKRALAANNL